MDNSERDATKRGTPNGRHTVSHCKYVSKRSETKPQQMPQATSTHLCVIDLAGAEQGSERVVSGNGEASNVHEESASNVEEDEEEVQAGKTEDSVDLGHRCLLLEIVEGGVFRQLRAQCVSIVHQGETQ